MQWSQYAVGAGTRLVHIGPHKTGTTAIQGSFHAARERLAEHGVVYAGNWRQPVAAVNAALERGSPWGVPPPRPESWQQLKHEINQAADAGKRVVLSSERLANANPAQATRIVDELGGSDVHIVVTLRPLAWLLSSAWQQWAQDGLHHSYTEWLNGLLYPPYEMTPVFWKWHTHDALVQRWASVVGIENVTVIALDPTDRGMLFRAFEALLGMPEGVLQPDPESNINRSLDYGEVELSRRMLDVFKELGWPGELHRRLIHHGGISRLKRTAPPSPPEQKVVTPRWAAERAAEIGAEAAAKLATSDVRVIGDLDHLGSVPENLPDEISEPDPLIPSEAAVQTIIGVIENSGLTERGGRRGRLVNRTSSTDLLKVVVRRARRRLRRRARSLLRPST